MDWDMSADRPPDGLAPALTALWWLRKGGLGTGPEWERRTRSARRTRASLRPIWCMRSRTGSRATSATPTIGTGGPGIVAAATSTGSGRGSRPSSRDDQAPAPARELPVQPFEPARHRPAVVRGVNRPQDRRQRPQAAASRPRSASRSRRRRGRPAAPGARRRGRRGRRSPRSSSRAGGGPRPAGLPAQRVGEPAAGVEGDGARRGRRRRRGRRARPRDRPPATSRAGARLGEDRRDLLDRRRHQPVGDQGEAVPRHAPSHPFAMPIRGRAAEFRRARLRGGFPGRKPAMVMRRGRASGCCGGSGAGCVRAALVLALLAVGLGRRSSAGSTRRRAT